MRSWLESIAGPEYASALIWTLGALILLLVVLVIIRIVRGLTFGTFVAGGRNRKTRLAVMDATAVDSHRRLVLVRRDDIEHLLLIGGPTDVVVEQNIRLQAPARRPQMPESRERPVADSDAAIQPVPEASKPAITPAPRPAIAEARPAPITPTPATSYARPQPVTARPTPVSAPQASPSVPQPSFSSAQPLRAATPITPTPFEGKKSGELDDALLKELEVTLNEKAPPVESAGKPQEADDEMSRLLGDLSMKRDK